MFLTKKALPRRTFLKGVGATVALPLLDAMVPSATPFAQTVASAPRRAGFIYLPHGFIMDDWTPLTAGADFEYPRIMRPLEPFRNQMVAVSGMDGAPNGGQGGHATGPASFLNDVSPRQTEGNDIRAGETVDQMLAKSIGQATPFPSLEVATEDFTAFVGACEIGYSCTYLNTISWSSPTTPLPMEINPRVVFERLFGGTGTPEQRARERQLDRSILDAVTQQANRMQIGLGSTDRARVSEYLDNVREIERRIQRTEQQNTANVHTPDAPLGVPENYGEHANLMFDLLTLAFQTDLTRVFAFMMARDLHARTYLEIGVDEGHHSLSHHRGNAASIAKFTTVNIYHVSLFAKFLERLQRVPDADGTLLDHSTIVFGSGMSIGNSHSHIGLPFVVAGGGVKGNRHIIEKKETPHGNLLRTAALRTGLEIERVGLGDGLVDL